MDGTANADTERGGSKRGRDVEEDMDDCLPISKRITRLSLDTPQQNQASGYPQLQKPAPFFKAQAVVDGTFKEVSLDDYRNRYLVLFFYPLDFTFVCPTEIIAFSEAASKFREMDCEVVGCSTDSHFTHLAWINTPRERGGLGKMDIPLLADKTMAISRAYGVLKEDEGIPFRGLFIIDGKGILRQMIINDLPVGRSVDEVIRLVQAYQFTDVHGEVCPAGWKPGDKTMVPDPEKSKTFFKDTD